MAKNVEIVKVKEDAVSFFKKFAKEVEEGKISISEIEIEYTEGTNVATMKYTELHKMV
jgi:hypothetical protein